MKTSPRAATEGDAVGVAALLSELGYPTEPIRAQHRLRDVSADPNSHVLVVSDAEGKLIGLLSVQIAPYFPNGSRLLRITALVVAMSHRRTGIGESLLASAEQLAVDSGCAGIELTTAEDRTGAHAFYERIGFERTSLRYFRSLSRDAGITTN